MFGKVRTIAKRIIGATGFELVPRDDPRRAFHSDQYLRHNARRLEHLASLSIPVAGLSVLEVGAGIGDLSHYYVDRGCTITITDARAKNFRILKERYPASEVELLDLERPSPVKGAPFDLVHCYGVLYHLSNPAEALAFLARSTGRTLLLETCVSFGDEEEVHLTRERQGDPTQAYSGTGCRPTRPWLFRQLQQLFEHVYVTTTQPHHEEFPLDWTAPEEHRTLLQRSIFVASRVPLDNPKLVSSLPLKQTRPD